MWHKLVGRILAVVKVFFLIVPGKFGLVAPQYQAALDSHLGEYLASVLGVVGQLLCLKDLSVAEHGYEACEKRHRHEEQFPDRRIHERLALLVRLLIRRSSASAPKLATIELPP